MVDVQKNQQEISFQLYDYFQSGLVEKNNQLRCSLKETCDSDSKTI